MTSQVYYLHALTPLHPGSGQATGIIDQPIVREKATHLPLAPGPTLKGVLRYELQPSFKDPDIFQALFGPDTDNADDHAGALSIGDGQLLCFPVRSWYGTFAWATCPFVLHRFQRRLSTDFGSGSWPAAIPSVQGQGHISICAGSVLEQESGKAYFEDLDMQCSSSDENVALWAAFIAEAVFPDDGTSRQLFGERFAVMHDDDFNFLTETATEIRARIRLNEATRTVANRALWYEEYLPAESILWGVLEAGPSLHPKVPKQAPEMLAEMLALLPHGELRVQIGGNATIGSGQTRWVLGGA